MKILFTQNEYTTVDGGIQIPLETVINKLPAPERKRFAPVLLQAEAERMLAVLIASGIQEAAVNAWLSLNFQQTRNHTRSAGVFYRLVAELDALRLNYGVPALNQALGKVVVYADPQKATIAYLRAVLKNTTPVISPLPSHEPAPTGEGNTGAGDIWEQVKAYVRERRGEDAWYNTWLRRTRQLDCTDELLLVGIPDELYIWELNSTQIHNVLSRLGWQGGVEFRVSEDILL